MPTTDGIIEVYRILGRILNDPASFGLADRAPRPLVDELTKARKVLMDELVDETRSREEEDFLAAELSQDADLPGAAGIEP